MQGGVWNGEHVLAGGWAETMAMPSANNANFGLGMWLGSPFTTLRSYFEGGKAGIPQSEPYLVDDVRIMEGGGFRVIYMAPSEDLVIFGHGQHGDNWDGAWLVTALRFIGK